MMRKNNKEKLRWEAIFFDIIKNVDTNIRYEYIYTYSYFNYQPN